MIISTRVIGHVLDQVTITLWNWLSPHISTSTTTMLIHKSQKRAEVDERIDKILDELSIGQFQFIYETACTNNVTHMTLLQRMNRDKFIAESCKLLKLLEIPEENALIECITCFAIVGHILKHMFIHELIEEIHSSYLHAQNDHTSQPFISDS